MICHYVITHVYVEHCLPRGRFYIDGYISSLIKSTSIYCRTLYKINTLLQDMPFHIFSHGDKYVTDMSKCFANRLYAQTW